MPRRNNDFSMFWIWFGPNKINKCKSYCRHVIQIHPPTTPWNLETTKPGTMLRPTGTRPCGGYTYLFLFIYIYIYIYLWYCDIAQERTNVPSLPSYPLPLLSPLAPFCPKTFEINVILCAGATRRAQVCILATPLPPYSLAPLSPYPLTSLCPSPLRPLILLSLLL